MWVVRYWVVHYNPIAYWDAFRTWIQSHGFKLGGHFSWTFRWDICRSLYMVWTVILVNLSGFPIWSPLFTSAYIGRFREVLCLFDFSLRELVPLPDSITPVEFQRNRSNIVSIIAARVERRDWDIGRCALLHKSIFESADHPVEATSGVYNTRTQIDSMLKHGLVWRSQFSWDDPILFVLMKDGNLWFCVDYRWLNKRAIMNGYPLRLVGKWWTVWRMPSCLVKLIYGRDPSKCHCAKRMFLKQLSECIGDYTNILWCLLVLQTPLCSSCTWWKTYFTNIWMILWLSLFTT